MALPDFTSGRAIFLPGHLSRKNDGGTLARAGSAVVLSK
jgi:hypothetical protein